MTEIYNHSIIIIVLIILITYSRIGTINAIKESAKVIMLCWELKIAMHEFVLFAVVWWEDLG